MQLHIYLKKKNKHQYAITYISNKTIAVYHICSTQGTPHLLC